MTTNETPEERPHAEFGPSGLKPLTYCRGFKNRGGTSKAAERGTRIHFALETEDPSELEDESEYEIYQACLADLESELALLEPGYARNDELRLYMDLGSCETFGTADVVAIDGSHALLLDFKTGTSVIDEPPANWQAKAYAIGVFQKFPQVETVKAVFSVPVRQELLSGMYFRNELKDYIREVGTLITEAAYVRRMWDELGQPPLELLSPNDNCMYCHWNEANRCPALGAIVFDVVKRYDAGGALPAEGSIHGSDIDDPEVLSRMLPIANIAEKWASGVKRKSMEVALRDKKFPGYTLRSMGAPREVSDPVAAKEYAESCGFSIDEILKAATFSISKLADVVKAKAPRGQKTDAVRAFEDGLETFGALTRKSERFSLKPLTGGGIDDGDE